VFGNTSRSIPRRAPTKNGWIDGRAVTSARAIAIPWIEVTAGASAREHDARH
jgi:hypothetical protein